MFKDRITFLVLMATILGSLLSISPLEARDQKNTLGNEILYYIIVDRFYDGNTENNIPNWAYPSADEYSKRNRYWLKKMFDENQEKFQHYWGGDIEGVIEKLSYLEELGITAIMLSPIMENVNGIFRNNGNTAYHGYWTKDWYRIEEHFANPPSDGESLSDALSGEKLISRLVDLAHEKGIKVLLDLSFNHTSPVLQNVSLDKSKQSDFDRQYNLEFSPVNKNGVNQTIYCRPTMTKTCGETIVSGNWFNPPYSITDWEDPYQNEVYQLHTLADLNQRDAQVSNYLINSAKKWINLGVDGFRIDAIKHIYKDFLLELEESLVKEKDDLILIGEYFDGGSRNDFSVEWLNSTEQYTMFDFSLAESVRDFFRGKSDWKGTPQNIQEVLASFNGYEDGNKLESRSENLVTFINNHDLPRMISLPKATEKNYLATLKFLFMSRGIPKITYGDEFILGHRYNPGMGSLLGNGGDPWCRIMMEWPENFQKNEAYMVTKNLIEFRKKYLSLRYGSTRFLKPKGVFSSLVNRFGYNYIAMERKLNSELVYVIYSAQKQDLEFSVSLPDGVYRDSLELSDKKKYIVKDGVLILEKLSADQVVILSSLKK
jgi:glycosidase